MSELPIIKKLLRVDESKSYDRMCSAPVNPDGPEAAALIRQLFNALESKLISDGGEGSQGYDAGKYLKARRDCFAALAKARGE